MLNTPESHIKFTDNDLIRLQKVQDRLDNYIKEIDLHAKRLAHLENECEKKEKERIYLDDMSVELKRNIEDSKKIASVLDIDIQTKKKTFHELEQTSKEIQDRLFFHEDSLKERELILVKKELEHEKKVEHLSKSIKQHEEKKAIVDKSHRTLKDFVNSLQ